MSLKLGLFTFVTTNPGINALIGTKFFPEQAKDSADLPYVTYSRISEPSIGHMEGVSGIANTRFQLDVYAEDAPGLDDVTEAFRNALDGFIRGLWGSTFVQSCIIENQIDDFESNTRGDEEPTFRTLIDISVWYDRAEPTG